MSDSTEETLEHIKQVRRLLVLVQSRIEERQTFHDVSKLLSPEKEMFDEHTFSLRTVRYGSREYGVNLRSMGPALRHHYRNNRHHPEHFPTGVNGMSLLDIIEMLADWKASTLRHPDGDLRQSLDINKERFEISDQLFDVLVNTALELGWMK